MLRHVFVTSAVALAAVSACVASAQNLPVEGPLPNEEGALMSMFAEQEACSDASPGLKQRYAAWLARGKLEELAAEARTDPRYAALERAFAAHLASPAPHADVVTYCEKQFAPLDGVR
jgi:hypothetical protein